ncbi:MAG: hypothetical protein J5593_06000, partial [Bacteroidaceae bacterium]|nr:hypothetical protein [Bacteroidaceae bacterium]
TASGESVTIGTDTYYASNTTVTLTYSGSVPTGYVLDIHVKDANNNDIAVTEDSGTYTFTMPASDTSISVTLIDVWGIADGADGSEAHPYIITTTTGLDLLATCVNDNTASGFSSDGFTGKFFKLGANITYDNENDNLDNTENNYTAIGSSNNRNFRGTFDGDGHTIRGIRIYKGEDNSSSNNQGLFGYVSGGTVKNVTLKEARITGRNQVGGIVGYLRNYSTTQTGTIDNCHVDGTVIIRAVVNSANYHGGIVGNNYNGTVSNCTSGANLLVADGVTDCAFYGGIAGCNDNGATISHCLVSYCSIPDVSSNGAIAGYNYGNSSGDGILTANYYSDCIVGGKTTDVGCNGRDRDGARSVHQLNMGAYTTATGETIDIDGITYYAAGTTVTLSCTATLPEGFIFHGYKVNGTVISSNTFTMPAEQSRAAAYFLPDADTYLGGGDGTENNPYIITTVAGLNLVSKAVSLDCYPAGTHFRLGADIAYDPNTLTIDNDGDGVAESNYTPIGYARPFEGCFDGQGHTVSGIRSIHTSCGLFGQLTHADGYIKNVTVADAVFIATYSTYAGAIAAFNNQGLIENCRAVGVDITCSNTFTGAIVGLTTDGLLNHNYYFDCTVTKSGTTSATNIGTGMCLVEGSQPPVYGDVTSRTYGGVTYTDCAVEGVALADNADNTTVISNNTGTGKNVMLYGRTLWKDGAWNTLCLPFDLTLSGSVLDGADVRELVSATITNGTLRLGFTTEGAVTQLTAGTPYIIKWASGENLVNPLFENVTVTSATNDFVNGSVSFKGTYEPITFDADNHNILFMGDSNTLYWPKSGAHINAFRAYFQLADGSSANNFVLSFDDDEPTMVNGQWGAEGVSVNDNDEWFTLGGVKLNGAPKTKGIYINNGKKVVIK